MQSVFLILLLHRNTFKFPLLGPAYPSISEYCLFLNYLLAPMVEM